MRHIMFETRKEQIIKTTPGHVVQKSIRKYSHSQNYMSIIVFVPCGFTYNKTWLVLSRRAGKTFDLFKVKELY